MHPSGSKRLNEETRAKIVASLGARLADGVDLYTQIKVAHWNIKGPQFAALHPLFDEFASSIAGFNDDIAERLVTLGGLAHGTARQVAQTSKLAEIASDTTRDLELVRLLADRLDGYAAGLYETQALAGELGDPETEDLLTGVLEDVEKKAWFLRASLS